MITLEDVVDMEYDEFEVYKRKLLSKYFAGKKLPKRKWYEIVLVVLGVPIITGITLG